ncbi:MAG: type II toxin-antitoxin system RelE/ParE family toxin [Calditrichaceae bacterium]
MVKKVIWSRLAHDDRLKILVYWKKRNKSDTYSKKLNQIFKYTAKLISKYPKIGKRTEIDGIRYKVVNVYLFTYRETKDFIEILTIWNSRQDPEKFERIIKKDN